MTTPATSRRRDIPHLRNMSDYEFAYWLYYKLPPCWEPRVHAKLDGFYGRIGRDWDGNFFFQTARSPVLRDPQEILWFALSKDYIGEALVRASHMAAMFAYIRDSDLIREMPKDTVYECEFFYRPLAVNQDDETITFVTVPYAQEAFKLPLTIYVHRIADATDNVELDNEPLTISVDIDVRSSRLNVAPLPMVGFIEYVHQIPVEEILLLRSQKQADRARKLELKQEFAGLREELGRFIMKTPYICHLNLGPVEEGLVVHINTKQFKIVSLDYQRLRT